MDFLSSKLHLFSLVKPDSIYYSTVDSLDASTKQKAVKNINNASINELKGERFTITNAE